MSDKMVDKMSDNNLLLRHEAKRAVTADYLYSLRRLIMKTWSKYFQQVWDGSKTFEIRHLDKEYWVGQEIVMLETVDGDDALYTGRYIKIKILGFLTWLDFPAGIKPGYGILSTQVLEKGRNQ